MIEWALSAFTLLLFAFGLLAVGQLIGEYAAVRSAATQAAFAAARAPSLHAAQAAADRAGHEAVRGTLVRDFAVTLDAGSFQRGATLTVTATGCADLGAYPIISQALGGCARMRWQAHAMIEPFRSRSP
jgi:Flp pilus assembly protein TadG